MKLTRFLSVATFAAALAAPLSAQGGTAKVKPAAPATQGTAVPAKATARCGDGTWSLAATAQGACSSHGGVAKWFGAAPDDATARCKDGEYWTNATMQGACSSHGGIAMKYPKRKPPAHPTKPT